MAFMALPILFSLIMAFTNWQMTEKVAAAVCGFENLHNLFTEPRFWKFLATLCI